MNPAEHAPVSLMPPQLAMLRVIVSQGGMTTRDLAAWLNKPMYGLADAHPAIRGPLALLQQHGLIVKITRASTTLYIATEAGLKRANEKVFSPQRRGRP